MLMSSGDRVMCGQMTAQLRLQEPEGLVRERGMGCASVVAVCSISIPQLPEGLADLLILMGIGLKCRAKMCKINRTVMSCA